MKCTNYYTPYCAEWAGMRVYNRETGHFFDMHLRPINDEKTILSGTYHVSRFYKSGYYTTDQITLGDAVGNQRYEGHGSIGFRLYINNPLEDLIPPEFIEESFRVDINEIEMEGHQVFEVSVSFEIIEDNIQMGASAHLFVNAIDANTYSYQQRGDYCFEEERIFIRFYFTQFYPNAYYDFGTLRIFDIGGNETMIHLHMIEGFNDEHMFYLDTLTPDYEPPELDLNRIEVYSEPINPDAPNGETLLRIHYYARDNLSGLGTVTYAIRNPLGVVFGDYHYHGNSFLFFIGDPTAWTKYTIEKILPAGSVPGTWGLLEISLSDKPGNKYVYNFSEIVTFQVLEEED